MVRRTADLYRKREIQCDQQLSEQDWNNLERLAKMPVHRIGNQSFVTGRDFCEAVERLAAITSAI